MESKYYDRLWDLSFLEQKYPKMLSTLQNFKEIYAEKLSQLSQFGDDKEKIRDFCRKEFLPIFHEIENIAHYVTNIKGLYISSFKRPHCDFESLDLDKNLSASGTISDIEEVIDLSLNFLKSLDIKKMKTTLYITIQDKLETEIISMKEKKENCESELKSIRNRPLTDESLERIKEIEIELSNLNIEDRERELKTIKDKILKEKETKQGSDKLSNNLGELFNSESELGKDSSKKQMN